MKCRRPASWGCYHGDCVCAVVLVAGCHLGGGGSDLSLGIEVFLNLRMVTDTSCSRSQPRRLSGFLEGVAGSDLDVEALSCTPTHKNMTFFKSK